MIMQRPPERGQRITAVEQTTVINNLTGVVNMRGVRGLTVDSGDQGISVSPGNTPIRGSVPMLMARIHNASGGPIERYEILEMTGIPYEDDQDEVRDPPLTTGATPTAAGAQFAVILDGQIDADEIGLCCIVGLTLVYCIGSTAAYKTTADTGADNRLHYDVDDEGTVPIIWADESDVDAQVQHLALVLLPGTGGEAGLALSDDNPVAPSTANPGTGLQASRDDHRHPRPPLGSNIQSVGSSNSAGTGTNYARDNHVHDGSSGHPVYDTGGKIYITSTDELISHFE